MGKWGVIFLLCFLLIGGVDALIEISDCQGLQNISKNLYEDYILVNDIDCSDTTKWNGGAGFIPIGPVFFGSLDGKGHVISDLYIKHVRAGMFETLTNGAEIRNLRFVRSTVELVKDSDSGYSEGGVLVYFAGGSQYDIITIDNIQAEGSVYGGTDEYSGGLIGRVNRRVTVSNSHFSGYVEGAGGFVGQNDGIIVNCSFSGIVNGTTVDIWYSGPNCFSSGFNDCIPGLAGGFAGWNFGTITTSYSKGSVEGFNNVGGFVGGDEYISEAWRGEIFDSYSTANVTALDYKGGFVGYNVGGNLINCFSSGQIKNSSSTEPKGGLLSVESTSTTSEKVIPSTKLFIKDYNIPLPSENGGSTTGGFLAYLDLNKNYECYDSFWDVETSGVAESACAANGKTTAEMQNPNTYSTWDINLWSLSYGNYPCLLWQEDCSVIEDSDNDGILDSEDQCPGTVGEQLAYGCSCEQILELRPGEYTDKDKEKCSKGTVDVFVKSIGWAKNLIIIPPYNPFMSYFFKLLGL